MTSKVSPAVVNKIPNWICQINWITLLQIYILTTRNSEWRWWIFTINNNMRNIWPDMWSILSDIGIEMYALIRWLGGRQTPLHATPPGAVVRNWNRIMDLFPFFPSLSLIDRSALVHNLLTNRCFWWWSTSQDQARTQPQAQQLSEDKISSCYRSELPVTTSKKFR